ncbi:hypothetical protein SCLCIDRAFT_33425 [Scleroderma citrinum Foug A]|uniref:Uncharacterized protein n=1 Tax=Scleroderma citrinum Foug A TaxID=1036808 RepID=A0A0C2ZES6_9AGAM|nr:hypothetical protein SCLCIDRAFT_33425 [Scleroderma citrinum Foug A]
MANEDTSNDKGDEESEPVVSRKRRATGTSQAAGGSKATGRSKARPTMDEEEDSMSDENESSSDEAMDCGQIKVGPPNKAYFIPAMGHKGQLADPLETKLMKYVPGAEVEARNDGNERIVGTNMDNPGANRPKPWVRTKDQVSATVVLTKAPISTAAKMSTMTQVPVSTTAQMSTQPQVSTAANQMSTIAQGSPTLQLAPQLT